MQDTNSESIKTDCLIKKKKKHKNLDLYHTKNIYRIFRKSHSRGKSIKFSVFEDMKAHQENWIFQTVD